MIWAVAQSCMSAKLSISSSDAIVLVHVLL